MVGYDAGDALVDGKFIYGIDTRVEVIILSIIIIEIMVIAVILATVSDDIE